MKKHDERVSERARCGAVRCDVLIASTTPTRMFLQYFFQFFVRCLFVVLGFFFLIFSAPLLFVCLSLSLAGEAETEGTSGAEDGKNRH